MNKKAVIFVLVCCVVGNLSAWGVRFFIDLFNLKIDLSLLSLILRMTFIASYAHLIYSMYYFKRNNRGDLTTSLPYSHNFDLEKYGSKYTTFMFKCSLILFIPIIVLSGVFQFVSIDPRLDLLLFIISIFIFSVAGYEKSRNLSNLI